MYIHWQGDTGFYIHQSQLQKRGLKMGSLKAVSLGNTTVSNMQTLGQRK